MGSKHVDNSELPLVNDLFSVKKYSISHNDTTTNNESEVSINPKHLSNPRVKLNNLVKNNVNIHDTY